MNLETTHIDTLIELHKEGKRIHLETISWVKKMTGKNIVNTPTIESLIRIQTEIAIRKLKETVDPV